MSEVYIGITLSDGSVVHMSFATTMRAPKHPGGPWSGPDPITGHYTREASDDNIDFEVSRASRHWQQDGKGTVSWRRLSDAEHEMFSVDRIYRNALQDVNGKIQYNMAKAGLLHKELIRHQNGDKLMTLDREWLDASAKKDTVAMGAADAKRDLLRSFENDPRIDAAASIEELKTIVPSIE